MKKIVLATGNAGKVKELNHILENVGFDVIAQTDLGVESVEETGLTFIENALLKARHAAKVTGLPALADDSGLSVNSLNGAPGIYSARYSGVNATDQQNLEKLLVDLKDVSPERRQATFNCALVFLRHAEDPVPLICYADWSGIIIDKPIGTNGFGYDPIFFIPELDKTAAQMSKEEKHSYSHRGQALNILLSQLTILNQQGLL